MVTGIRKQAKRGKIVLIGANIGHGNSEIKSVLILQIPFLFLLIPRALPNSAFIAFRINVPVLHKPQNNPES